MLWQITRVDEDAPNSRPGLGGSLSLLCLAPLLVAAAPMGRVDISLHGLRSGKGMVRVCLTKSPKHFPDCNADPKARSRSVPAVEAGRLSFTDLEPGSYALALFHDENANARLDTFAKIPREGFGFSRNPKVRFGAPSFRQVAFPIQAAPVKMAVRMQYFL
jgi:uncharacterized protein (DUF2141 family)